MGSTILNMIAAVAHNELLTTGLEMGDLRHDQLQGAAFKTANAVVK